jgi:hypothetical protein
MRHEPWAGPFESHEDYDERRDAYNAGYDNTMQQRDGDSGGGGGGCFLTTACIEFAGLPPDCRELAVMRGFRDRYIKSRPDGETILCEYYTTAPALVRAVKSSPERETIFSEALERIRMAVSHIEAGRFLEAFELYVVTYSTLLRRFTSSDVRQPLPNAQR